MATKLKDHYDADYAHFLADKTAAVEPGFDQEGFLQRVLPTLETLQFGARQELIVEALTLTVPGSYEDQLATFTKILEPELPGSLGMSADGWWLWPVGRCSKSMGHKNQVPTALITCTQTRNGCSLNLSTTGRNLPSPLSAHGF